MSTLVRESISFERGGDPRKTLNVGRIARLKDKYDKNSLNKLLVAASRAGNLEDVKFLVNQGADLDTIFGLPIQAAAIEGHLDIVKYLLKQGSDITSEFNAALRSAARAGHLNIVKYLMDNGAGAHPFIGNVLVSAAAGGYLDVVKYLIDYVHPDNYDSAARIAEEEGNIDVAKYLNSKIREIEDEEYS